MVDDTLTPNLQLTKAAADRHNWTRLMNSNLSIIDAVVGTFFAVQSLKGVWQNSTAYSVNDSLVDTDSGAIWQCQIAHTSAAIPTTFAEDRAANPTYWTIYASPARSRGVWQTNTQYAINDFVVNGAKYAICVQTHTSGSNFDSDVTLGYWSVLIDVSSVGSSALPAVTGAPDANKFVITNPAGTGYQIYDVPTTLGKLGATSVGLALFTAISQGAALSAIGAQPAGSYQPLSSVLTTLAAFTLGAFADDLLACADAAAVRTAIGLSTLATTVPATNIAAFLAAPSSANLAAALTDETGSSGGGFNVFSNGPTLTNPVVGTQTAANNSTRGASTAYVDRVAVQQTVATFYNALDSSSATIPYDDTIPQNTEGSQILTVGITPKSATSKLRIHVNLFADASAQATLIAALFKDSEANARQVAYQFRPGSSAGQNFGFTYEMTSGSTSATTFSVRIGTDNGSTVYLNGTTIGRLFGGAMASSIQIEEIGI